MNEVSNKGSDDEDASLDRFKKLAESDIHASQQDAAWLLDELENEEDATLDRFGNLDESILQAMSQQDAAWLLDELKYEEVDGPVQALIHDTKYVPMTILRLAEKAGLVPCDKSDPLTVEEMETFLGFATHSHQMVKTASKILANPFTLRRLDMLLPNEVLAFLNEMDEAEEEESAKIAAEARKSALRLVKPDTKSA